MASIISSFQLVFIQIGIDGIDNFVKGSVPSMKRKLFQHDTVCKNDERSKKNNDMDKLIAIQALALSATYNTTCFDVKQLQEVLGVGESNVYRLLRSGQLLSQRVGRRIVVPVSALAQFLVMGEKNS